MKINLTVKDGATAELRRLMANFDGAGMERLHRVAGKQVELNLRGHFDRKELEPRRRKWARPPQHFWARMARATSMIAATGSKAVVTVADPAFAARVHGAVIRPKDAKALAIPLKPQYAGVRPRAVWERDGLFIWKSKAGKTFIARDRGDGHLSVVYRLVSQVKHPKDPTAMPERDALLDGVADGVAAIAMRGIGA
jgi:hypothetical protein